MCVQQWRIEVHNNTFFYRFFDRKEFDLSHLLLLLARSAVLLLLLQHLLPEPPQLLHLLLVPLRLRPHLRLPEKLLARQLRLSFSSGLSKRNIHLHFAFLTVFLTRITSFLASSLILPISSSCLRTCALIFSTSRETTEEEGRNC